MAQGQINRIGPLNDLTATSPPTQLEVVSVTTEKESGIAKLRENIATIQVRVEENRVKIAGMVDEPEKKRKRLEAEEEEAEEAERWIELEVRELQRLIEAEKDEEKKDKIAVSSLVQVAGYNKRRDMYNKAACTKLMAMYRGVQGVSTIQAYHRAQHQIRFDGTAVAAAGTGIDSGSGTGTGAGSGE